MVATVEKLESLNKKLELIEIMIERLRKGGSSGETVAGRQQLFALAKSIAHRHCWLHQNLAHN